MPRETPVSPAGWERLPPAAQASIRALEARIFVQAQPAASLDETGGRARRQRAWRWAAVMAGGPVFGRRLSRRGTGAQERLGARFGGDVVTARWRHGSVGTQSADGSRVVEAMRTMVATLKHQHRPVLGSLTAACETALQGEPVPSWLPSPGDLQTLLRLAA
jgi:hypothetical protein